MEQKYLHRWAQEIRGSVFVLVFFGQHFEGVAEALTIP